MDDFLTPDLDQSQHEPVDKNFMNTQLRRAKKLGVLAIDTTDPTLFKEALDAVEEMQPWLHEQINKRTDKENGR